MIIASRSIPLLMIQRAFVPRWRLDFWTAAHQAIDD